jgi:DNA-binding NarL/FixJ family response regulator
VSCEGGAPGGAPLSPFTRRGALTVVVADDSTLYRHSLARAVRAQPALHLVAAVESGEAAVAAVEALAPDVLMVDLRMPGLDGIGVLARLAGRELVKVLVTASLDDDVERDATAAGASACLPKALSCEDICAAALAVAQR